MRRFGALAFSDVSDNLISEISDYISKNNQRKPYLIMNNATAVALNNVYNFVDKLPEKFNILCDDGFIGKFKECKVYTDNNLKFGEVDLY